MDPQDRRHPAGGRRRWLIVAAMALVAVTGYFGIRGYTPAAAVAGVRRLTLTPSQEIALGLQAAPAMAQRYGGLSSDQQAQRRVDRVCHDLVEKSSAGKSPYDFDCHVLADPRTVDAFALPGGQVFITAGLLADLSTDGELAAVLAHQIAHVVDRDATRQVAGYDSGSRRRQDAAALTGRLIDLRFTPGDELGADRLAVRFMSEAGYDPRALIEAMRRFAEPAAGAPPAALFRTHPNPVDRLVNVQAAIEQRYPRGVPAGMRS
jgi:predicted Zn-dependent protease